MRDIYDVRVKLEPEAAVLAHRRLTTSDAQALRDLLHRMHEAGQRKDYLNASKADMSFHQLVWKLSGNLALEKALNAVSVSMFAFSGLYLLELFSRNTSNYTRICDDHWLMLAKLKDGPSDEVAKVFREKLQVFQAENLMGAEILHSDRAEAGASGPDRSLRDERSDLP